jgi:hypothetical protein
VGCVFFSKREKAFECGFDEQREEEEEECFGVRGLKRFGASSLRSGYLIFPYSFISFFEFLNVF